MVAKGVTASGEEDTHHSFMDHKAMSGSYCY